MIKLAENTKILRVVKVRVNCKELQKESIILGSSNKIAKKKKSEEIKVKSGMHWKKTSSFLYQMLYLWIIIIIWTQS